MPVLHKKDGLTWQLRSPKERMLHALAWLATLALIAVCWQFISAQTFWIFVQDAPEQANDLLGRMFPPRWSYINELWLPLWDTLTIATLGTLLAIILATPVAFLAARNTSPHAIFRGLSLLVIVSSRSVHSLIWSLLLVFLLGPGVFAGVIAIGLRSIGFIAKLLYEAIEEIDPRQVEAIRATGASGMQVLTYGVMPQILPTFAGVVVFRWDINIRESTIVGLVGAGGIGLALDSSISSLSWSQASVIFACIFALVLLSEWVSARVRRAII
jgi:phosphonate transport system permease protein